MPGRSFTLTIGPQGRIVIPAAIRRELDLEPGDELTARAADGSLVLTSPAAAARRLSGMFAHLETGATVVDELIAERRAEAARED